VSDEKRKNVAFLQGHGETSTNGYNIFRQELAKSFNVQGITLSSATSYQATGLADADVLVVAGPQQNFVENEKQYITQYLENGGKAFFLVDGVQIEFQTLNASIPEENSFADFVENTLGVRVTPTIVYDVRSNESVQFNTGGPVSFVLPYAFWPRVVPASQTPITKNLQSVVYSWGGSVKVLEDKLSGAEATPLLKTTQFGGEQKDNFILQPNQDFPIDRNSLGERVVAMLIKNFLGGSGRAVVSGSSSMLSDQVAGGKPGNIVFGLNVIDWLAENEDLISIRSKTVSARILIFPSLETQSAVRYGILIGIPFVVIAMGALILYMRKRKTKRVY